jgi:glutamate N-acetyltransferase / amino-acid N-acetyltransferase
MAVGEGSVSFHPVPGVRLAATCGGIKGDGAADVVLFEFAEGSETAAVFTQSLFAAAPVVVGREHLSRQAARFFLVNSGNANAATGDEGIGDAQTCCQAVSQRTGTRPEQTIPFSTGVIGEPLPVEKITNVVDTLCVQLDENNWLEAAQGIMTTDTRPKICSRRFDIQGTAVTVTGIAKGSGMIQPNMATMLAYIATDAAIERTVLQEMLNNAVNRSFNRITVDSDTSTNDSCMLTATGVSGVKVADASGVFYDHLQSLMQELAQGIVRDGEGATKFVTVVVDSGPSDEVCLEIAYAIANSPLMKTAIFASDANWGRIVMAIGKAPVSVDATKIDVYLGDVRLMLRGGKDPEYHEDRGAVVMAEDEITIRVCLNAGDCAETVWTSDLSHEYVRINAEYRT